MTLTRRGLFGLLPALGALAVPTASSAQPATDTDSGPILLEYTCDWGKSLYTPAQVLEAEAAGRTNWGCGTKFQWYFGINPHCPKCGYCYLGDLAMIKRGVYRVVRGRFPE